MPVEVVILNRVKVRKLLLENEKSYICTVYDIPQALKQREKHTYNSFCPEDLLEKLAESFKFGKTD
jgi:hypothetical protein